MSMISGYAVRRVEDGNTVSQGRLRSKASFSITRQSIDQVIDTFTRTKFVEDNGVTDAFDPNAPAIKAWEHVLLVCVLYQGFAIPYFLAFQPESIEAVNIAFVFALLSEFLFAVDLYVRAITGYYSSGNLVRDKKLTRRRYFRSYHFAADLIAVVPWQLLVLGNHYAFVRLTAIKFLRCLRLGQFVSSLDELYATHFVLLKLLKVLVSMVYIAHVLACLRYSFGYNEDDTNHWLPPAEESHHPLHTQYLSSLFWSVGIMTGLFEGELPRHISEFLFTTLVALCGFSMFTTLVATIFVISKCESGHSEAVEARINQLVHLLSFHRVPESQQTQAIEYLRRYYTDEESDDREAAKRLCQSVANDIQVELLKATFAQIPIFEGCSDQFIVAMTSLLEMISVPAQSTLFSVGDDGDAMYIVHSGVLAVIIKSVTVREIRKGTCFGELSVFSSMKRSAAVMSTTYSILYKLTRFHCERVLHGYPECAKMIAVHIKATLDRVRGDNNYIVNTVIAPNSLPTVKPGGRSASISAGIAAGTTAITHTLNRVLTMNGDLTARASARRSSTDVPQTMKKRNIVIPTQIDSVDSHVSTGNHSNPRRQSNHRIPAVVARLKPRHGVWRYILRAQCIDQHSHVRFWWLLLLQANLCHSWLMIPVQVVFPLWQRPSLLTLVVDSLFSVVLYVDILLNFNLSFMADSEKIMDPMRSAQRYFEGPFFFDLLCALPYQYLHMARYGLLRLPRLLRVFHLKKHLEELEYFVNLNSRRQLVLLGVLLIMLFHIVACIHFAISYVEGFNPNEEEAWISSTALCLRRLNSTYLENCNGTVFNERTDASELRNISAMEYSRSLYYAVGVLASPGKSAEPDSDVQLVAALLLMLSGFLVTAIVVDNVQKRFTASAFEQKEFFATSTRIQLFLRRQNAPLAIHQRVKSFLDYWWSSHRGAVIGELLADLPRSVRIDVLRSICLPVLQTLALLQGIRPVRDKLEEVMVENVKFILYGQGETVYRHGDYVTGMFFLLEGEVCVVTAGGHLREVPRGGFFGTAALTQQERGEGYTEHVSANSGRILLFVSRDQLQVMEGIFPALKVELLTLQQRLLNNKLAKSAVNKESSRRIRRQSTVVMIRKALFGSLKPHAASTVYDPDSMFILAWETWVLFVMTAQWILVMFQACFQLAEGHEGADIVMVFIEACFVVDMYIRSRLGFYEYGNKLMNLERIKRAYIRSGTFVLDIIALLPLYIINWGVPVYERWDLLNVNKLLRLFKVPSQLHALETRYLKRTTELRLFKLLYYTFMLSHFLGCIWFNFASKVAVPNFSGTMDPASKQTAFGENPWLPHAHLEHAPHILQYMASLYWSFGLMSASSEPEFPKTTAQCVFSVLTMTSGFFLFAYVVGNFTDIIELTSSETREFNAKMGAVRQMLNHFQLPDTLQERLKTFFLFKRFHTITQEHLLVHCLPPSLLTDIRLVHLKRMIEKVEFLSGMEGSVTRMLVSQFTQVLVSRGEFICKLGEKSSDMFFVFTGVLDVFLPFGMVNASTGANGTGEAGVEAKTGAATKLWRLGIRQASAAGPSIQRSDSIEQLKKVNEISAGSYFGENGLFTNGKRNAYIQAQTSCILYKLSRESLELVFDRYPEWKQKVMRIVNIHREQTRLLQLSREEQSRGTDTATGLMLSRADIMNQRAERIKDEQQHVRFQQGENGNTHAYRVLLGWVDRFVLTPLHCLVEGTEVQSDFHLLWLRFMVACILYVSILTPYQLAMDDLNRSSPMAVMAKTFGLVCEFVYIIDVWFSWHVRESPASMELYEQDLRSTYKKERMFWDTIAAIPFYRFLSDFHCRPWLRLLRCLKIFNVVSYLDELNRRSVTYEITRFWYICLLYLLLIYWAACAYLAVATEVGFGTEWDAWLPSQELVISNPEDPSPSQLALRFLRGLFFATTTFVKKARNLAPDTAYLYAFHIAVSFVGLITMSFVLGELASLFISHIGLEVDFRKNHIAIELYLARLRVSDRLKDRAHAFMTSLWSSHAGVNYEEILGEMPRPIRTACVLHVSKEPVGWFIKKVITPLCWEGSDALEMFRHDLVERLHFEGYPSDECIVVEGSVARAMYFVLRGHLRLQSRSLLSLTRPIGLRRGDFFGERGFLGTAISAFTVQSVRACDLFSLNSQDLVEVMHKHAFSHLALRICESACKHLKEKNLAPTSKLAMEDYWGAAMLKTVNEFRKLHKHSVRMRTAGVAALVSIGTRMLNNSAQPGMNTQTDLRTASLTNVEEIHNDPDKSAKAGDPKRDFDIKPEEFPKHVHRMFAQLKNAQDCYAAFSPLLQMIMPTDPLDWNTSFRHGNQNLRGEALSSSIALQKGGWLSTDGASRVNSVSNKVTSFHAEDSNGVCKAPETPSTGTMSFQSFAMRLRHADAADDQPNVDAQESVAFSMRDDGGKSRNTLGFDGIENQRAPPVHVLHRDSGDDTRGSARKYTPDDTEIESLE